MSRKTEKAFDAVAEKVAELKKAIAELQAIFETNAVGLDEWSDDLSDTLYELEEEVYGDE